MGGVVVNCFLGICEVGGMWGHGEEGMIMGLPAKIRYKDDGYGNTGLQMHNVFIVHTAFYCLYSVLDSKKTSRF